MRNFKSVKFAWSKEILRGVVMCKAACVRKCCAKYLSSPLDGGSFRIDCSARFATQNRP